eukprot:scpid27648/ scgid16467/ 
MKENWIRYADVGLPLCSQQKAGLGALERTLKTATVHRALKVIADLSCAINLERNLQEARYCCDHLPLNQTTLILVFQPELFETILFDWRSSMHCRERPCLEKQHTNDQGSMVKAGTEMACAALSVACHVSE